MVHKRSKQFSSVSSKKENFCEKIDRVIKLLDEEIIEHKKGKGRISSIVQLEKINKELQLMRHTLSSRNFRPTYPRIIVDSWDYTNTLGIVLLEIYDDYLKL